MTSDVRVDWGEVVPHSGPHFPTRGMTLNSHDGGGDVELLITPTFPVVACKTNPTVRTKNDDCATRPVYTTSKHTRQSLR